MTRISTDANSNFMVGLVSSKNRRNIAKRCVGAGRIIESKRIRPPDIGVDCRPAEGFDEGG